MQPSLIDWSMIAISFGVFVYLVYALLFPERF